MAPNPVDCRLEVEVRGQVAAAHFGGRQVVLTEDAAGEVLHQLSEFAEAAVGGTLVLSLAGVVYLSSTALGRLVGLSKRLRASGGKLVLCGLSPNIHERFTRTGLHAYLDIRQGEPADLFDLVR
jgi:anti-sigma B factor antagonist